MRTKVIKKEDLIQVAEKIIRDEGLAKCSMRRISRDMGVAVGTVYNYYESRDLLLVDVFEVSWRRTIEAAKCAIDSRRGVRRQIEDVIQILIHDISNRNGLGKIIFQFVADDKIMKPLDLRAEFILIMSQILESKIEDENERVVICGWIILMIFERLGHDKVVTELDYRLINRLIG